MDIKAAIKYKNDFIDKMVIKYNLNKPDENIYAFEIALENDDNFQKAEKIIDDAEKEIIKIQEIIDSKLYSNTQALEKQIAETKKLLKGVKYG